MFEIIPSLIAIAALIFARKSFNEIAALRARLAVLESAAQPRPAPAPPPLPSSQAFSPNSATPPPLPGTWPSLPTPNCAAATLASTTRRCGPPSPSPPPEPSATSPL